MTVLNTERLFLTPKEVGDFQPLVRLWTQADFTAQIGMNPMTPEVVWFRLLRDIGHWKALGYGSWAIRRKEDHAFIGSVGIFDYRRDIDPPLDAPELGWGLEPAFQGQGYALEALNAVLEHADQALEFARTVCMIGPDNLPSIRLAEKAGFGPWREGQYLGRPTLLMQRGRREGGHEPS